MKRPYQAMKDFCLKNAGKIEKDIHKIENLEQRVEDCGWEKSSKCRKTAR